MSDSSVVRVRDLGRIGAVVDVKVGLRLRRGVIVADGGESLDVQVGPDVRSVAPGRLKSEVLRPARTLTMAGRVEAVVRDARSGGIDLGWDPELLWPTFDHIALHESATALALDLAKVGDFERARQFAETSPDGRLVEAWIQQLEGRPRRALELLLEGDPDSRCLPSWAVVAWLADGSGPIVDRVDLLPSSGPGVVATLLNNLSTGRVDAHEVALALPYLRAILGTDLAGAALLDGLQAVVDGKPTGSLADRPIVALHNSVSDGRPLATSRSVVLNQYPVELTDDLIDAGAIGAEAVDVVAPGTRTRLADGGLVDRRQYLLGRLAPHKLSDAELVSIGFDRELRRRALLPDRTIDEELLDHRTRELCHAVDSVRAGEELSPEVETALESVDELGRTLVEMSRVIRSGSLRGAPPGLLDDPSVASPLVAIADLSDLDHLPSGMRDLVALRYARDFLYGWQWSDAAEAARAGLRFATDESVRDELLNLLACALWELGNDDAALAALEKALEGEYSEALLVNVGVVASNLDPVKAVRHLAQLADEAPNLTMRALSAERALGLWYADPDPWQSADADLEDPELPSELVRTLRDLIAEPLEPEQLRRFCKVLSVWDDVWLSSIDLSKLGSNASKPEARLAQARARGLDEFVTALAAEFRKPGAPGWLADDRDDLVRGAVGVLLDDSASHTVAAHFGLLVLESGLDLEPKDRIPLVALSVAAVAHAIDPAEGEPQEKFVDWILAAQRDLGKLEPEMRESLRGAIDVGLSSLCGAIATARAGQLGQLYDLYNDVITQIRSIPRHRLKQGVVQERMALITRFCADTDRLLMRLVPHLAPGEQRTAIEDLLSDVRQLKQAAGGLP